MEMIGKCSAQPFYYDCDCDGDPAIDVEELISRAMISAKEAEAYYFAMAAKADCEVDKDMFCEFCEEQKKAYALLQQILRELTCECYCVGDLCIDEPEGFCSAIKTAIYNEMDIINDYENIAYYLTDMTQREVMVLLIDEARVRAEKLAALYEFAQACACKCGKDKDYGKGCNPNPCCCYVCCYDACGRPILPHQMPPCPPSPCPPFPEQCGSYHCPPPRPYPGTCGCNGGCNGGCGGDCGCKGDSDCGCGCDDDGVTNQICISGTSAPCSSTSANVYGTTVVSDNSSSCGCSSSSSTTLSSITRSRRGRRSPWGGQSY